MRLHDIRAKQARQFKAAADSDHTQPVAANVLDRQFAVEVPDARWAAGITYISRA